MDVFEAIKTRRSTPLVKSDVVPKELIEKVIEAATYAPNHHRTEPWRFYVLTGDARNDLGKAMSSIIKNRIEHELTDEDMSKIQREEQKPLRAPVIITVAVEPTINNRVMVKEEYAAVCSAIQNMLLAAHALGLGAIWRTGNICTAKEIKDFYSLSEHGEVVGFIYLGYPDIRKPLSARRKHISEVTTWLE